MEITVPQTKPYEVKDSPWTNPSLETLALLLVNQLFFSLLWVGKSLLGEGPLCICQLWCSFFYFHDIIMGTWRLIHVLKGIHICCALGAGRQHCYWGPNLIFSLFWSSTFNHWLLGVSAFSPKIVGEPKENVIAVCLCSHTCEEETCNKEIAAYVRWHRLEWIVEFWVKTAA